MWTPGSLRRRVWPDRLGRHLNIGILSGSSSDSEVWPRLGNQEKKLSLDMSLLVNAFQLKAFSSSCSGSSLIDRKAALPGLPNLKGDVWEIPWSQIPAADRGVSLVVDPCAHRSHCGSRVLGDRASFPGHTRRGARFGSVSCAPVMAGLGGLHAGPPLA